ncbi:MAG: 5-formyltetrahydrofolate cyclo-ligase [Erythrobacter sp.]|nr:MAG: 5-formyltetrahydrofolate cyclo-ligase [Erythrobacter sp.]
MTDISEQKAAIRNALRKARREYAAALPPEVSALVFRRPPAPVLELVPEGATIGFYRADPGEAPASSYARFFMEAGHRIALPRVTTLDQPMAFHLHTDPYGEGDLIPGVMGLMQPAADAPLVVPEVLFMPLVGFTERGERIGQGGGYYDRWLAAHPSTIAIGLAWDMQMVDDLPVEAHDMPLTAVITPTRIYGPFA